MTRRSRWRSQATATWAEVAPSSSATRSTSRAIRRVRSVRRDWLAAARLLSSGVVVGPRVYLPVRMPAPIGAQAVSERPNAAATGSSSRSAVRSIRLYSACRATSGLQPRRAAKVLAADATQAGASDRAT